MAVQISNKLGEMTFSVADYHKMMEIGVLPEDRTTEILEGKLIKIMPIGSRHASVVAKLAKSLERQIGDEMIVWAQNPVAVNDQNEPIPDVALLRWRDDFYADELPTAKDVLLIIEVADSTLATDRKYKTRLYAEAEIPEVWIVNLQREIIEVYRQPQYETYVLTSFAKRGEILQSENVPNLTIKVDGIL